MKMYLTKYKPYLLLVPASVFFLAFVIVPFFYTVYLSFFDWNMISPKMKYVGISNYIKILTDKNFTKILSNTFLYIFIIAIANFVIPYIFAFICKYVLTKMQDFYKVALFLPGFISLVVASMLFVWILNPLTGPLAALLEIFGLKMPIWSTTEGLVVVVISLITAWSCFGYNFITLLAAVGSVPQEIIEAARLDNIPTHKIFYKIVIPVSGASGYYVLIMTMMQALGNVFGPIDVLTKGGPDYGSSNLIYEAYFKAFTVFETGESAALSIITMIVFAIIIFFMNKIIGKRVYYAN